MPKLAGTSLAHPLSLFLEGMSFAKLGLILAGTSPAHALSLFLEGMMSFAKISLILAGTVVKCVYQRKVHGHLLCFSRYYESL